MTTLYSSCNAIFSGTSEIRADVTVRPAVGADLAASATPQGGAP